MAKGIFAIVFMLTFLGGLLFSVLIYPIWMMVHCANSTRSTKFKAIWIILMVLIMPLVSYIYGLFASKRKLFQWISSILILLFILLLATFIFSTKMINKELSFTIEKEISRIDKMQIMGLGQEEQSELKYSLRALQKDLQVGISKMDKASKAYSLVEMFGIITEDGEITPWEYDDWMDKFNSRDILDKDALRKYIDSLKKEQKQEIPDAKIQG